MITPQDHIEELRAALRRGLDADERGKIAIELEHAIAALDGKNRAADRPPG